MRTGLRIANAGARQCDGTGNRQPAGAEGRDDVGVAVEVEGLTKSFGSQNIWTTSR